MRGGQTRQAWGQARQAWVKLLAAPPTPFRAMKALRFALSYSVKGAAQLRPLRERSSSCQHFNERDHEWSLNRAPSFGPGPTPTRRHFRIMPPKLSSHAPDTLHNIVTRGMMAILGLGALTVILDPASVKSYPNEVEYAKARKEDLRPKQRHRCNDRLEDFIQAMASEEGSIVRDFMPTARLFTRCMMSRKGEEPTDPYVLLGPWNPCYIDPAKRAEQRVGTHITDSSPTQ